MRAQIMAINQLKKNEFEKHWWQFVYDRCGPERTATLEIQGFFRTRRTKVREKKKPASAVDFSSRESPRRQISSRGLTDSELNVRHVPSLPPAAQGNLGYEARSA